MQPASVEPPIPPSEPAAGPSTMQSSPEPGPSHQAEDSSSIHVPETGSRESAPSGPAAAEAVHPVSRAHLFIFDSESQEDDSESLVAEAQPAVSKEAALCLTQLQLEEDMQQIRDLMNQTEQVSVVVHVCTKTYTQINCSHKNLCTSGAA